jgi:hypothetical protein
MRKISYLLYAWTSTIIFILGLIWLATIPNLANSYSSTDEVTKVIFRMVLYSILLILVYRSFIVTLKNTVTRLSKWRSLREQHEDAEFVLIIETLVILVSILSSIIVAFIEEFIQSYYNIEGRKGELQDILISTMAILLTSIVVYSMPVIGELEVALKHKTHNLIKSIKNKKK